MSSNLRMSRINKQLQRELALIFESQVKKSSMKGIIITGVECTKDLMKARVFFTAMEPRKRPGMLKDLREIAPAVRSMLGQTIRLRRVPELEFVIDTSEDYGARIDAILDSLGFSSNYRTGEGGEEDDE
ncbi:MAG: 30S ribosome-binding factor RbfA [Synergistaceae bacterium]|nr:30S ribosome-binding factor RbfA [Synergistaceae bacterium]